jgi:DNA-directed RNA polymerase sigma subunit (sigma70/sigma32)
MRSLEERLKECHAERKPLSREEVAELFGISTDKVAQIENMALRKLRAGLRDLAGEYFKGKDLS